MDELVIEAEAQSAGQEVVLEFFKALGDWSRLGALFAEDATWTLWGQFPFSGTYVGRQAIIEDFHIPAAALFGGDGLVQMTIKNLIGTGETVAAELEYQSPTAVGKQYHNHYVHVFAIHGGLIHHVREYMDTQELQTQCLDA
jgi:ketosteroid isomerase-like protein